MNFPRPFSGVLTGRVKGAGRQSGAAFVEFALVFPILLLVVFGIIQFGLLLNASITLNNAAEMAARFATLKDPAAAAALQVQDVEVVVKKAVEGTLINPTNVQVAAFEKNYQLGNGEEAKRIVLTYNFPLSVPYVLGSLSSINLSAQAVMQ